MKQYRFETSFFPMIKNSWGWIINEESFMKLEFFLNLSFEEIEEFFKLY